MKNCLLLKINVLLIDVHDTLLVVSLSSPSAVGYQLRREQSLLLWHLHWR